MQIFQKKFIFFFSLIILSFIAIEVTQAFYKINFQMEKIFEQKQEDNFSEDMPHDDENPHMEEEMPQPQQDPEFQDHDISGNAEDDDI